MSQLRWFLAPGIVFHEFSHWLACAFLGVSVFEVKWFGAQAYVKHAHPTPFKSLLITLAPLFVGQAIGFALFLYAFGTPFGWLSLFFFWLGISILLYSFPSTHDVSNAFRSLHEAYAKSFSNSFFHQIVALFSLPLVALPLSLVLAFLWILDSVWILRGVWTLYVLSVALHAPAIFL